jgi:hypothetical protein
MGGVVMTLDFKTPSLPDFISDMKNRQYAIEELSDAVLTQIADAWRMKLLLLAAQRRKQA